MIEIKNTESIESVADWIELTLAIEERQLSRSDLAIAIERSSGDDGTEAFVSSVWRELEYRQRLYSNLFFKINGPVVEWVFPTSAPIEYLTCLIFSVFGVQGNTQIPGKLFERIARKAVENYLHGQAIILGFPFEPLSGTDETKLKQMVRQLAVDTNERFIEAPSSDFKDRGVDIVGWMPHDDHRSNQIVVLLQCGAGLHWETKKQVPIRAWKKYIHWANDPMIGMVVPCIINDREWEDQSDVYQLLFDRVRLMNLLQGGLGDIELETALRVWAQNQLEENSE